MTTIQIHSIPLKEVIRDLAEEFGTSYTENCDEYTVNIPPSFGSGKISGINFKDGLGIIIYNCTFNFDLEIRFIVNEVHPLKFLFCEAGHLTHYFENDEVEHKIDLLENIIIASSAHNGHIINFKAAQKTIINSLEVNRELFAEKKSCEINQLDEHLQLLFNDVKATQSFYHHGSYSVRMADLFNEINGFAEKSFVRNLFLEGSAFKILSLQLIQYSDDIAPKGDSLVLRKMEMMLVQEASSIINSEILNFKSVQDLSNKVGINVNKLQNGFKVLYQTTVNGYVQDRRLDLANNFLKNSEYTISEIVDLIGLSSKSYFSKLFKEKYGHSPSAVRKNNKNQKRLK